MSTRLPERIDPVRLAERRVRMEGELELMRMKRLSALLVDDAGTVAVVLGFTVGPEGRAEVTGSLVASVRLVCQRCLEPVELALHKTLHLAVVASDAEAQALPPEVDPLPYGEDPLSVADLVEDELLLLLPQEAKHTSGACAEQRIWSGGDEALKSSAGRDGNPFGVLEQLKRRN